MKLKHLLSLRRYRRCTRMFRRPLRVHLQVAAARRRPLSVELVRGGSLRVADVRESRPMFNWLLDQSPDPLPVAVEDGLVTFRHAGRSVALLPSGPSFMIFKEIFADDVYRLSALSERLGTVVDIGANVGMFAVRVAPVSERVICVEPVEANLAMAQRNIARAGASHKITLHRGAVAGESGKTARIFLSDGNAGAHSVRQEHAAQWGNAGFEDVPTISLADLFDAYDVERCSFLKCDAEGSEYEIFESTPPEILARVDRIALEIHLTAADWNLRRFDGLCDRLRRAGFALEHEPLQGPRGKPKIAFLLTASRGRAGAQSGAA